jgi:hypothetical protein
MRSRLVGLDRVPRAGIRPARRVAHVFIDLLVEVSRGTMLDTAESDQAVNPTQPDIIRQRGQPY